MIIVRSERRLPPAKGISEYRRYPSLRMGSTVGRALMTRLRRCSSQVFFLPPGPGLAVVLCCNVQSCALSLKEDCLAALRRIGVARTRESNRLASLFMVPLMVRPRSLSQPEELRIMIMMPRGALKKLPV